VYVGVKWTGNPISQVIDTRNTMAKTSASQQALVAAAVRWLGQPSERRTLQDVMPGAAGTQPGAWGQDTTGHAMGLYQAQKSGLSASNTNSVCCCFFALLHRENLFHSDVLAGLSACCWLQDCTVLLHKTVLLSLLPGFRQLSTP
jgi:hypothetical protein